jgi:branched-chain amino acid aminotransferase
MSLKSEKIWMDGALVGWDDANIHVMSHGLHYGTGYFEGIRCYGIEGSGSAVFRLREHVRRFRHSGHILGFPLPYSEQRIEEAVLEIIRVNGLKECYIRPLAFLGTGEMGLYAVQNPVHVIIAAWAWGAYLGEEGIRNGIRAKVASYTRHHVNIMMTNSKISGNYVNSVLAKNEVKLAGYDEAIMLDSEGFVAEASGENIFIVRDGVVRTPPTMSILPGITRSTVIQLARDQGHTVVEERFARDELYVADEVFLTGTAAEVTPIHEVDDRLIGTGTPGPITTSLQEAYFAVIRGKVEAYRHWLTPV